MTMKRIHIPFGSTEAKERCSVKPGAKLYKLSWLTSSNHKHLASRAWLTPSREILLPSHSSRAERLVTWHCFELMPEDTSSGIGWTMNCKIPSIRWWRLLHAHIWLKAWLGKGSFLTAFILKASKAWIEFSSSSFCKLQLRSPRLFPSALKSPNWGNIDRQDKAFTNMQVW